MEERALIDLRINDLLATPGYALWTLRAIIERAPGDQEARLLPTNLLVWDEGNVTFMISADAMGETELLAVAEGLEQ